MKKPDLAKFLRSAQSVVSKHSPEILTGIGIAGMVTTTILAVKATPKAMRLVDKRKEELETEKLPALEVVKTAWKPYVPVVVTGVASIACLVGASSVSLRRNAALTAAYKISETALAEYREKVVETIGEKKEKTVRDKIAEDKVQSSPVSHNEVFITEKGNTLCYEPISGRYFKSDIDKIRRAQNTLNATIIQDVFDGGVSVNDYFDELGLEHTDIGGDLGWSIDKGLINMDFSSTIADDGTPCIVINHIVPPKYGFSRF